MDNIVYLKAENKSVFLKYINSKKICRYYVIGTKNKLYKLLRKLNIINSTLLGKWKYNIKKYDYIILSENEYFPFIAKYIKRKNPKCKTILYFWNIVEEQEIYKQVFNDKNIDEFWTFDKNDAKRYNMKYNPQFYTKKVKVDNRKNEYDILFLGRPKKRKKEIQEIEIKLKQNQLKTNFKTIESEKEYIPYNDYLDMVSKSKCILDYNQEGQVGLSLRPMEALFLEKKLITNNKDIKNYNFYNSNNIFIIGEDNIGNIKEFINKPYKKIDQEIIDYYDFEQWLKRFTK